MTRPGPERVGFTNHARDVMRDRGVTYSDVMVTIREPQIVEPHDGARRFIRHGLVAVVSDDGAVITLLWRRREQWTSAQMRAERRRR